VDPERDLEDLLGGPLPSELVQALDRDELAHLAEAVRGARRAQIAALVEAGDAALGFVPALLRRPVRKVVGL
jgi:hypothetical protein